MFVNRRLDVRLTGLARALGVDARQQAAGGIAGLDPGVDRHDELVGHAVLDLVAQARPNANMAGYDEE